MSTGTGTNVSKGVGYAALEPNPGENVSKTNTYAVLTSPSGANLSKANAYAVLTPPAGLNVSKVVAYAVLIPVNSNPPVWPSFTFATGVVGVAYSQTWDLAPAAPPTTYTLQAGTLPPGLSLSNVTDDIGKLSGTPTTAGTYSFTLRATNAYGVADQPFTMTVTTGGSGGGAWIYVA